MSTERAMKLFAGAALIGATVLVFALTISPKEAFVDAYRLASTR